MATSLKRRREIDLACRRALRKLKRLHQQEFEALYDAELAAIGASPRNLAHVWYGQQGWK